MTPRSITLSNLRTGREVEDLTDVLSQSVLLQLPVLQAVLAVEVEPGHVVGPRLLAVLSLSVLGVQLVALAVLDTVLHHDFIFQIENFFLGR